MSDKNEVSTLAGQQLDVIQVEDVAGGGGTVSVGTGGFNINSPAETFGSDVIRAYEGLIESTSYAIERIANALRN